VKSGRVEQRIGFRPEGAATEHLEQLPVDPDAGAPLW
jgi:RimJ/RimL family protein N-acetyltransferase